MLALLSALCLLTGAAAADTLNASGTVEPGETVTIFAPIGGKVGSVKVEKGMKVEAGEILAEMKTEKVYAPADGKITGIFVRPGDDAEEAVNSYGAVMYLEGSTLYTVSASTGKAYSSVETTLVHVGETVYLQCRKAKTRTGVGVITAVDGSSYTVQVTEGSFIVGDSVYIYRDGTYATETRIGGGSVSRVSPVAVSAAGAVVSVAVQDGDQVRKGDLLMETLEGSWDAYEMTGTRILAETDGVVAEVSVAQGDTVSKGGAMIKIYPISGMRVEAVIAADDLKELQIGDTVQLELAADESRQYTGTISRISALAEEGTEEISYRVYIDFTPDEYISFGMSMEITAEPEQKAETETAGEADRTEETQEPAETEQKESAGGKTRQRPGDRGTAPEGEKPAETAVENGASE